jgi:prepilin-type N-terminal cleavage/methylation domain-containing protein
MTKECKMTNVEKAAAAGLYHSSFRAQRGVTIIELIIVIMIILILAGLVLSVSSYVQNKGARARAETEVAAMSAALESYKADNGIYPRDNPTNGYTDTLNARTLPSPSPSPSPNAFTNADMYLFSELSGLDANQQPVANKRAYFNFTPQMLGHPTGNTTTVVYLRDPFGNCYGYSTAYQGDSAKGFNPTFDLWSTANDTTGNVQKWIKNW